MYKRCGKPFLGNIKLEMTLQIVFCPNRINPVSTQVLIIVIMLEGVPLFVGIENKFYGV